MQNLTKEKKIMAKSINKINSKMRDKNKSYVKAIKANEEKYRKVVEEFAELNGKGDKEEDEESVENSYADLKIIFVLSLIMTLYFICKSLLM